MEPSYKLTHRIKDDLYEAEQLGAYDLYLQAGPRVFRLCVTDPRKNRCLLLEDYTLENVSSTAQQIALLENIYEDHHVLKAGFWRSIRLAVKSSDFSLVPVSLFDKAYAKDYLALSSKRIGTKGTEIFYTRQSSTDAINIFAADQALTDWFRKQYPGKDLRVVHHTTSLIEGILNINTTNNIEPSVSLLVEEKQMTVIVRQGRQLLFCNSFYYSTPEDLLYFVLFVFDQLKLNQETTQVSLLGDIAPDAAAFARLRQYIRRVNFGRKPSSMYFGYLFDEIPEHRYFDLYSMHLCD